MSVRLGTLFPGKTPLSSHTRADSPNTSPLAKKSPAKKEKNYGDPDSPSGSL